MKVRDRCERGGGVSKGLRSSVNPPRSIFTPQIFASSKGAPLTRLSSTPNNNNIQHVQSPHHWRLGLSSTLSKCSTKNRPNVKRRKHLVELTHKHILNTSPSGGARKRTPSKNTLTRYMPNLPATVYLCMYLTNPPKYNHLY